MKRANVASELAQLEARQDVALRQILRWRIRYFSDGVAIGSRAFVERLFNESRDHFGAKRKNGSRKLRGAASQAAGKIIRDRNNQNILALAYLLWNHHLHGTQTLDRALGGL